MDSQHAEGLSPALQRLSGLLETLHHKPLRLQGYQVHGLFGLGDMADFEAAHHMIIQPNASSSHERELTILFNFKVFSR